ncbi:hybrid sensor histidine kinase/response regulator [Roseiconus lacunae]|uniref:hybrid sensor histidine kinase/response regulator n=1 Tax=Roseiconus lacunae TaxID=2605694 RepID=UPI001E64A8D0|nr:ATP-binding protein [Roseiconus lacunae]MCD0459683.1 PAS domain S-box protein [Roseiconus lacunae]
MRLNSDQEYRHILIIDDNESIHADFDKILRHTSNHSELDQLDLELFGPGDEQVEQVDFKLEHAFQGRDGLEILKKSLSEGETFGAAFVDMRMPPGWDGVETIKHLWDVDPCLQVVICTAYSDHEWSKIVENLGQTDRLLILKKPFDEIEVVQLATSLCEKRRLLDLSRQKMESLEHTVDEQSLELQDALENAETLIQSISSILVSLDSNGLVSRWNPIAEQVFGIREPDAIGKAWNELSINWLVPENVQRLVSAGSAKGPVRESIQFLDSAGSTLTLEFHVFPIVDEASSAARLILANDITLQIMLKSQLDQAQRLESVGQLAAGVAHEINTPMQYISDNIRYVSKTYQRLKALLDCLPSLIDDSISDEEFLTLRGQVIGSTTKRKLNDWITQIPEALSDSIVGVDAVAKIVSAMKEFCHPGRDEKSLLSLNHILNSTITVARNEWKHTAELEADFSDDLPDLLGFPSELNQAFLNIIVNAVHAIRDQIEGERIGRGVIRISTRAEQSSVIVEISDNGGGIPSSVRDRVFEPFFTTKDIGKGTGQGLAIARSVIVDKHGGTLSFDVEEGEGTKFIIELPLTVDDAIEETDANEIQMEAVS